MPARSLPANLHEISLTYVPITTIDDDAFAGSTSTLETLTFQGARFTRIPDAFQRLTALKHLNIQDAVILDWNPTAMKNIGPTIDTLDLDQVGLSTWPTWIQYFTSMIALNIDGSRISSVPDDAFDSLINTLQSLSINNGSLKSVPKALSKLRALTSLDLGNNHIVDVTFLPQLSNLSSLTLYQNRIANESMLSNALRAYSHSMYTLEIGNNYLTAIPDFSFLSNVATLSFSHNRISDPHSGTVPASVYDLDFSYNFLPSIPSIWPKMPSVTAMALSYNSITTIQAIYFNSWTYQVELGNNLITELSGSSFPPNSTVRALLLTNNPVFRISNDAIRNLPQLIDLDLSGSKLLRLPLQLSSLTSLRSLDMSDSIYLVCTCVEKSLQSWIQKIMEVKGDCGIVTIQYFFTSLSPGCPDTRERFIS